MIFTLFDLTHQSASDYFFFLSLKKKKKFIFLFFFIALLPVGAHKTLAERKAFKGRQLGLSVMTVYAQGWSDIKVVVLLIGNVLTSISMCPWKNHER